MHDNFAFGVFSQEVLEYVLPSVTNSNNKVYINQKIFVLFEEPISILWDSVEVPCQIQKYSLLGQPR